MLIKIILKFAFNLFEVVSPVAQASLEFYVAEDHLEFCRNYRHGLITILYTVLGMLFLLLFLF